LTIPHLYEVFFLKLHYQFLSIAKCRHSDTTMNVEAVRTELYILKSMNLITPTCVCLCLLMDIGTEWFNLEISPYYMVGNREEHGRGSFRQYLL